MNKMYYLFKLNEAEEKALSGKCFSTEPMICMCRYFGLMLKADGHAELLGQPHNTTENWKPFRAEEWTGIVKLYKSTQHIVGLKQNGTVVACGYNDQHQCETDDWQDIREIYISDETTVGIDANGATHYTYTFEPVSAPTPQPAPAQSAPSPQDGTTPPIPSPSTQPSAPATTQPTSETLFEYKEDDENTVTITKYTGQEQEVIVPSTINGKTVTRIGYLAFEQCRQLISVTIPDSVTGIGHFAFYQCASLTTVTIPDSVTVIGESAFDNCTSLTTVTIPDSVTTIGYGAFKGCTHVTIYGSSFSYAERYAQEKHIPFRTPSAPATPQPTSETLFEYEVTADNTITITKYTGQEQEVIIPSTINGKTVTSIGKDAFEKNHHITSVILPDSVAVIGNSAFYNCTSLTSVNIPDSVTSIENWAFANCKSLTSVNIPDSVTSIGNWAFYKCTGLTSVTIPKSVTSIGDFAFNRCDRLTIRCNVSSYAEKYAKEQKIRFRTVL